MFVDLREIANGLFILNLVHKSSSLLQNFLEVLGRSTDFLFALGLDGPGVRATEFRAAAVVGD